jgi:hypothetical protein
LPDRRTNSKNKGQALAELLVVLPVLLLLLLAASDMGKLFAVSGKSEIAARYTALRHFREVPFGDVYPADSPAREIEGVFFNDSLDDRALPAAESDGSESDDPDVNFVELGDADIAYTHGAFGNEIVAVMWDTVLMGDTGLNLAEIRGARSIFAYDLPLFPYGREHPLEATLPLVGGGGELDASYDATGNFVMIGDALSGTNGQLVRLLLEASGLIIGVEAGAPAWVVGVIALYYFLFLPTI